MASPSNHGLLCCSSAIRIDSVEDFEDSESHDSLDEDEEEGGEGVALPLEFYFKELSILETRNLDLTQEWMAH